MPTVLMTDIETGHASLFDEAPGGGDPEDRLSLRNRPLVDPENWLPNIYMHTALDSMEVLIDLEVTINHPLVAALTPPSPEYDSSRWFAYGASTITWTLLAHDLGYVPNVAVVVDDNVVMPGYPVQSVSGAQRMRTISVYATSTQILLREWSRTSSDGSLSAVSKTYRVLVFALPPSPSGTHAIDVDPEEGTIKMGLGRFDVSKRYLQVVPGGSPFGLTDGRSIDLKRGAVRISNPDGSVFDTVATDFEISFNPPGNGGGILYYDGDFEGDGILVQAP